MMQTHRKPSKESQPDQNLSTAPDEAFLAAIEPPPYGTSHAVCAIISYLFHMNKFNFLLKQ